MARFKELIQIIIGVVRSTFGTETDIDRKYSGYNPLEKTFVKNADLPDFEGGKLNLLSWNILRDYSKSEIRKNLGEFIKKYDPGFIFIQEAPVYENGSFWDDEMFRDFNAYYAPFHFVKKNTNFYNFAHAGQLILSKYHFNKFETYQLPYVIACQFFGKNHVIKRLAVYAQINSKDNKKIGVYNVHLENTCWPKGRFAQLEYLIQKIKENDDDIVVIGGDFNTFMGKFFEKGFKLLEKAGFKNINPPEFRILPRLDYFFVKNAIAKGSRFKVSGSDHYPIMASLDVEESEEERIGQYKEALEKVVGITNRAALTSFVLREFAKTDFGGNFGKGKAFATRILGQSVKEVSSKTLNDIADKLGW